MRNAVIPVVKALATCIFKRNIVYASQLAAGLFAVVVYVILMLKSSQGERFKIPPFESLSEA